MDIMEGYINTYLRFFEETEDNRQICLARNCPEEPMPADSIQAHLRDHHRDQPAPFEGNIEMELRFKVVKPSLYPEGQVPADVEAEAEQARTALAEAVIFDTESSEESDMDWVPETEPESADDEDEDQIPTRQNDDDDEPEGVRLPPRIEDDETGQDVELQRGLQLLERVEVQLREINRRMRQLQLASLLILAVSVCNLSVVLKYLNK